MTEPPHRSCNEYFIWDSLSILCTGSMARRKRNERSCGSDHRMMSSRLLSAALAITACACSDGVPEVVETKHTLNPSGTRVATVESVHNGLGLGAGALYDEVHVSTVGHPPFQHGIHDESVAFYSESTVGGGRPPTVEWLTSTHLRITLDPGVVPGTRQDNVAGVSIEYTARPAASLPAAPGAVTLENWRTHPRIDEIRAIYEEIQGERARGRGTTASRRFDDDSPQCQATYPVRASALWRDDTGRVRAYVVEKTVSHREMMRIGRYYDREGRLRFVFVERFPGETRVYLGAEGTVLFGVSRDDGVNAIEAHDGNDWETKPSTAAEAKMEFEGPAQCPEVKPGTGR
jgi:hypothetical protein